MDDISEDVKGMAEEMEVTMITFSDVEAAGGINLKDFLVRYFNRLVFGVLLTICWWIGAK